MDAFASRVNRVLPRYYSRVPVPNVQVLLPGNPPMGARRPCVVSSKLRYPDTEPDATRARHGDSTTFKSWTRLSRLDSLNQLTDPGRWRSHDAYESIREAVRVGRHVMATTRNPVRALADSFAIPGVTRGEEYFTSVRIVVLLRGSFAFSMFQSRKALFGEVLRRGEDPIRRVQDLIHDISTLPDSAIKRLLEDRNALAE
eukprot:SAG11_NODE_5295_length_1603_cov_24.716755_1_plen_200_part_00